MTDYVAKAQQDKKEAVAALREEFKDVKDYIFADYRGLTVSQITEIRNKLREQGAQFKVVKNRFAKIAMQEMELADASEYLVGPTAVALSRDESGPVAKALVEFAKEFPIEVKGGLIAGDLYDATQVEAFSKLPTKDELIAMLMSTMKAPLQNFVFALSGVPTKLVRTLQAVADQKAES